MYDIIKKIQSKGYWFWNQICLWNVSSASWPWGSHGHFEWLAFDTNQRFFILKSIFSLNLCQVLQGCVLFLGLDIFFMVTRLWYRTKDIDFETKFFFGIPLGRESRKRKKRVVKVKRKSYLKRKWKKLERRTSL